MEPILRLLGLVVLLLLWGGGVFLFRWWAARADAQGVTPAEELAWPVHRGATPQGRRYRQLAIVWGIAGLIAAVVYLLTVLRPSG